MHGLDSLHRINEQHAQAQRILNAGDPGRKGPIYQGYGKGATTDDAPVIINASTGAPHAEVIYGNTGEPQVEAKA